ncbi:MAG: hypothetical protein JW779_11130 [Candidatus Thorarchaeota archaeon]|nr:hypothetical protein [Candidatus Thorarchaeota archaeon]
MMTNSQPIVNSGNLILSEDNHQIAASPSIWSSGILGRANESDPFTVWANVTDDDEDLVNVTVHVNGPNATLHEIMTFNGTYYERDMNPLPNPGTFDIYVSAIDTQNNTRIGRHISVTILEDIPDPVDPIITLPIVVISSIALGAVVFIIALQYEKRQQMGNQSI